MTFLSFFFFSSRRRHTRYWRDWSSDVCSSDLTFDVTQTTVRQKRFSSTVVCVTSKVELCGSWLKSHDTVWSRLMPMMPLKRFDPAALTINSLISSAEVSRAASNVKSMTETLAVGTRIEVPSSLPL